MTTEQLSIVDDADFRRELASARRRLDELLSELRDFSTLFHTRPWVALDDLLAEIRAAATTVAVLEGLDSKLR